MGDPGQYGLKKLVEHIWMLIGTARTCENMVELRRKMAEMNGKNTHSIQPAVAHRQQEELVPLSRFPNDPRRRLVSIFAVARTLADALSQIPSDFVSDQRVRLALHFIEDALHESVVGDSLRHASSLPPRLSMWKTKLHHYRDSTRGVNSTSNGSRNESGNERFPDNHREGGPFPSETASVE